MLKTLDEATKAQLKFEFRQMYKSITRDGAFQVLYELIESANLLAEVITEEIKND